MKSSIILCISCLLVLNINAATYTWNPTTGKANLGFPSNNENNWLDGNSTAAKPTAGSDLVFGFIAADPTPGTQPSYDQYSVRAVFGNNATFKSYTFNADAGNYRISYTTQNALWDNGFTITNRNATATQTFNNTSTAYAIYLNGTVTINTTGNIAINGALKDYSSVGGLVIKEGGGTLSFTATAANMTNSTFSGNIEIRNGTVMFNRANSFASANSILLNGGTLHLNAANAYTGDITWNTGTLHIATANAYAGTSIDLSSEFTLTANQTLKLGSINGVAAVATGNITVSDGAGIAGNGTFGNIIFEGNTGTIDAAAGFKAGNATFNKTLDITLDLSIGSGTGMIFDSLNFTDLSDGVKVVINILGASDLLVGRTFMEIANWEGLSKASFDIKGTSLGFAFNNGKLSFTVSNPFTWSETPIDNKWSNDANWIPNTPSSSGGNIVLGTTTISTIDVSGVSTTIGTLIVDSDAPDYTFSTDNFSYIKFDNLGIINNTGNRNAILFDLSKGGTIEFAGNSSSGLSSIGLSPASDLTNPGATSASIIYSDNATAGNKAAGRDESSFITLRPGSTLDFKDNANSAALVADLSGTRVTYSNNAQAGNLTKGNSLSTYFYLYGSGSNITFTDNAQSAAATFYVTAGGSSINFIGNSTAGTTTAATAITVNDATGSGLRFTASDTAHIVNLTHSSSRNNASVHLTGDAEVVSRGTFSISGNNSTFLADGNFTTLASSTFSLVNVGVNTFALFTGNATIRGTGTITSGTNSATAAAWTQIAGNTCFDTGDSLYTITAPRVNGGFIVAENVVFNWEIGKSLPPNLSKATAANVTLKGNIALTASGENAFMYFNILKTNPITTQSTVSATGNNAKIVFAGDTILSSSADTGIAIGSETANHSLVHFTDTTHYFGGLIANNGADTRLVFDKNATFSGIFTEIQNNGANATVSFLENADYFAALRGMIYNDGANASLIFNTNGTITTGPTESIIHNSGTNASILITGNTTLVGNHRINNSGENAAIIIQGTPTLNETTFSLANGTLIIAADAPVAIANLTADINAGNIHFTGTTDQELIIGGNNSNLRYLNFTENTIRGSVTKIGTGTLTLDNESNLSGNFTINDGTLTINKSDALASATLFINNTATANFASGTPDSADTEIILGGLGGNSTTDFALGTRNLTFGDNNRDTSFSGTITGTGNIVKIGTGTFTLEDSAYLSSLNVAAGYLGLSVNSATDYTTATIGTLNLDTVSQLRVSIPLGIGLPEGTVLSGVLTLTELNIDGVSNIAGLKDLPIETDGRATFTFNSSAAGIYDLVAGKPLAFSDSTFAATSNQRAVGSALDELEAAGTNTALIDGFNTLNSAQITEVLNELSPAGLGAMADLAHRQAAADLRIITQRFDQYKNSPNAPLSGSRLTTGASGANVLVPDAETATIPWTAYFAIRHSQGDKDGNRDAPGYDHDSNGISIGIDQAFAKRRGFFGFQFAYENSEADLDYSRGEIELESFRLMTYLGWFDARGLWIQAHASFNMHDYETTRNLPTLGGRNTGNTDGTGFTGSLEIGKTYDFVKPRARIHSGDGIQTVPAKTSAWSHAPYARLTYDTASIDNFAEYGVLETDYEKQTPQNLASRLAWRLQWKSVTRKNTRLNANLDLGWEHEYMDAHNDIEFRFAGTTSRRTVRGAKTARDSFVAGLNLAMLTARDLHFTLAYDLDLNADYTDHRLNIGLGKKF